ncbi:MAG: glycosyltransferase family 2 protein [Candidatus Moranbacteria bacterium]|nr:glycosyltransferase family 2 protein [Candidatus Moranbacteria bacterium]
MTNYPKVFVIILNYNGKDVIKKCLTSVFKLDYPNLEVVLVDNNSADGSLEMAKAAFSKINFIKNEENLGFGAGNNIGIRFALERMADFVLLLNNDTEVDKDFLTKLIEVAQADEKIGVLSPVIFDGNSKQIWFAGGKIDWLRMRTRHLQKAQTEDYYDSDFITGCSMLVRAEVFKQIGLLDEDFFLYWEDADFSVRVKKAGFKNVVVSGSWIYHFEKSEQAKSNKIYWLVISGLIFFKKNTPFWLKPWIKTYVASRKIKNWLDVMLKKQEMALTVQKAYKDYQSYAKLK